MTEQTVYCEECVEDIPSDEVYWDEGRLYCRRCGSEVETPDKDIFEEIAGNRETLIFRDDVDEDLADAEDEDEEEEDLLPEEEEAIVLGDEDEEEEIEDED